MQAHQSRSVLAHIGGSFRDFRADLHGLAFQLADHALESARRAGRVQHAASVAEFPHGFLRGAHPLFRCFHFGHGQGNGVVLRTAAHGVDQRLALGQHGLGQFLGRGRVIGFDREGDDAGFRVKGGLHRPLPVGKAFIPRGVDGETADDIVFAAGEMAEDAYFSVNGLHDVRGLDVLGNDMRVRAHGSAGRQQQGGKAAGRAAGFRPAHGKAGFGDVHGRSPQAEVQQRQ